MALEQLSQKNPGIVEGLVMEVVDCRLFNICRVSRLHRKNSIWQQVESVHITALSDTRIRVRLSRHDLL